MGEINEVLKKYSDNNHRIKENGGVDEYYSKIYTAGQQDGYDQRVGEEKIGFAIALGVICSGLLIRQGLIKLGVIKPKEDDKQIEENVESKTEEE